MYRIFDRVIDSAMELPELEPAPGCQADFRFEIRAGRYEDTLHWRKLHEWTLPDGDVTIRCFHRGGEYLLSFPAAADFLVSGHGRLISCYADPGTGRATVRHLLVDQVVPRLMGHEGRLAVHAAAVSVPGGGCAALLGPTGRGKSTLAAGLHERGLKLMSDDCVVLEISDGRASAIPAYSGLRLWPGAKLPLNPERAGFRESEGYGGKSRFRPRRHSTAGTLQEASRLDALFMLDDPGPGTAKEMSSVAPGAGRESLVFMLSCLFTLDPTDRDRAKASFLGCSELLESGVRTFRLSCGRGPASLAAACDAVQSCIGHS